MKIMKKCYECGKKLKFWEGYRHPTLGRKNPVCSKCYDIVEESLEKYCNFILSEYKKSNWKEIIHKSDIKSKFLV